MIWSGAGSFSILIKSRGGTEIIWRWLVVFIIAQEGEFIVGEHQSGIAIGHLPTKQGHEQCARRCLLMAMLQPVGGGRRMLDFSTRK